MNLHLHDPLYGEQGVTHVVGDHLLAGTPHRRVGEPDFGRVTLYGKNRTPRAGARWWYVVRAVSTNGRRFSGTAIMRVVLRGKVIDTIGWFGFKGYLRRTYRFNRLLRGRRVVLQARVVGTGGVRTVGYLVRVR